MFSLEGFCLILILSVISATIGYITDRNSKEE